MTGIPYFHIGILVPEMHSAIERFSDILHMDFSAPTPIHFNLVEGPDGPYAYDALFTYSRQGPPYIELVEARSFGIHADTSGLGVHHVGFWEPSMDTNLEENTEKGIRVDSRIVDPDGKTFVWYSNPDDLSGVRLEFVDESRRDGFQAFFESGVMEDSIKAVHGK